MRIGFITEQVIEALQLNVLPNTPIFIGDSNIEHIKAKHPTDFEKYGNNIEDIVNSPDYVGQNPKDGSLEYVKEFVIDNEYVKVAVRVSSSGKYYARSLYILNNDRVQNFIKKGTLKPLTNTEE